MYEGKKILIIGAARSGISAARFFSSRGAQVTLSDQKQGKALENARDALKEFPIFWEEGENRPDTAANSDLILVSPGVPRNIPALQAAAIAKREVISEIELAFRHIKAPVLAITGSNGKSTTTVLLGEMLKQSGKNAFVGGNLGLPLLEAAEKSFDVVIAEISSFQLEWVQTFRPFIASILNISPNHLDRHDSFEDYLAQKLKIFSRQTNHEYSIFGADDPVLEKHVPEATQGNILSFSLKKPTTASYRSQESLVLQYQDKQEQYPISAVKIRGNHNIENALAALLMARLSGASYAGVSRALSSFSGLPHRLEQIRVLHNVEYINDSKATSVAATIRALEAFSPKRKIILLAGGIHKGASYQPLFSILKTRCRAALFFGEAKTLLSNTLKEATHTETLRDLEEALQRAYLLSKPEDIVLLAPACSSFDQFDNFEQRGETFRALVEALS